MSVDGSLDLLPKKASSKVSNKAAAETFEFSAALAEFAAAASDAAAAVAEPATASTQPAVDDVPQDAEVNAEGGAV